VVDSLFAPSLSRSSLVYLLVWNFPLQTPYISSPNHCLLFATHHAHTIATCFAVGVRLCHIFLVSLATLYLELFFLNITHPSDHSHVCALKCHLISFPYKPCLTSMYRTTSYTTMIYWRLFEDSLGKLVPESQNHSGFYWSKRWWGGSRISCAICRSSAPHLRHNHTRTLSLKFFTGQMFFLMP